MFKNQRTSSAWFYFAKLIVPLPALAIGFIYLSCILYSAFWVLSYVFTVCWNYTWKISWDVLKTQNLNWMLSFCSCKISALWFWSTLFLCDNGDFLSESLLIWLKFLRHFRLYFEILNLGRMLLEMGWHKRDWLGGVPTVARTQRPKFHGWLGCLNLISNAL